MLQKTQQHMLRARARAHARAHTHTMQQSYDLRRSALTYDSGVSKKSKQKQMVSYFFAGVIARGNIRPFIINVSSCSAYCGSDVVLPSYFLSTTLLAQNATGWERHTSSSSIVPLPKYFT